MSRDRRDGMAAGLVGAVMVATAGLAAWLLVTSGVLLPDPGAAEARPIKDVTVSPQAGLETEASVRVNESFQLSQPRDPFRPLITEDTPPGGIPGVGGTPGSGGENGGFQPGNTVSLEQIREVDGELVATIVVNGVTYEVREGETFADSFKVVDLTEEGALLQYGDIVFELKVGQQILK